MDKRRRSRADEPPALPLAPPLRKRLSGVLDAAAAAKLAVARRAKPSAVPDHVRLVLTLALPRELAEKLSGGLSARSGTSRPSSLLYLRRRRSDGNDQRAASRPRPRAYRLG